MGTGMGQRKMGVRLELALVSRLAPMQRYGQGARRQLRLHLCQSRGNDQDKRRLNMMKRETGSGELGDHINPEEGPIRNMIVDLVNSDRSAIDSHVLFLVYPLLPMATMLILSRTISLSTRNYSRWGLLLPTFTMGI